ncbi:hypothetical protein ACCS53_39405, partial [Rhizobium ruizarguesonis]
STGRHSEASAAEEQSRLRGERIERTLSQLSFHVPSESFAVLAAWASLADLDAEMTSSTTDVNLATFSADFVCEAAAA